MTTLLIQANDNEIAKMYENHSHFHDGDSGLDLFCLEDVQVEPGKQYKIKFGIKCEMLTSAGIAYDNVNEGDEDERKFQNSSYWLVPRSSISKTPLRMSNSVGLIDAGYRGEIMAYVDNIKQESYTIHKGDRLFQIVSPNLSPISIQTVESLSSTNRGSGGFGSSGR